MKKLHYKVTVKMNWEFIVSAENECDAIIKLTKFLESLYSEDGWSTMALKANEDIINRNFIIEEYIGFIVD